jgi:hypothetical protein
MDEIEYTKRYEDRNPNKRQHGCLFTCDDHGEWKERLKALDLIPALVDWVTSVKVMMKDLPGVIHWVDQKKGAETQNRLIAGGLLIVFLTGFMSSAWMFKSDQTANLAAFKLEVTERSNLFKTEISERQAALKLETSERQKVYEQNAKEQNAAEAIRISSIVEAVSDMKAKTETMLRLNEQSQKQTDDYKNESKALIKELQSIVLEHKSSFPPVKKKTGE